MAIWAFPWGEGEAPAGALAHVAEPVVSVAEAAVAARRNCRRVDGGRF